ncbi:hypothetical protein [Rhodoferax sp. BLA1]|uniref:hypothetical protein n=1 Tax=Rhodoferax sp. BLA1 TaxID=2576062 RepID=UPI0015D185A0|nr:hypothetical protein [Rhodoferax sp. BLA1]
MPQNYIDIYAQVRLANQQRSDAMGEILALGWRHLKQRISRLVFHNTPPRGDFAQP